MGVSGGVSVVGLLVRGSVLPIAEAKEKDDQQDNTPNDQ
jgi:hypothetical protein